MAFTNYKALDFSGIDKTINAIAERQALSKLGQGLDGTPEGYAKAAQALLQKGDVNAAANFFALGEKARERAGQASASKDFLGALGAPLSTSPRSPVAPAVQALERTPAMPSPGQSGFTPRPTFAGTEEEVQALEGSTGTPGQKVAARLVNNGLTPVAAAGLASNLNSESRFRTDARNPGDGRDGSDSVGLAQWNGPRAQALQQFASAQGKDWRDRDVQADFIAYELRTTEGRTGAALDNAQTPQQAAATAIGFFRPQGYTASNPMGALGAQERVGAANQFVLNGSPAPASGQFTPQQPAQVAQAPQGAPGGEGLYASTPTPALQAFIANPRVPDNLRTIMQQELARRGGGAPAAPAPVQLAQAPAQPGAPVSDVPVQGGAEVQGNFTIPGPNQLPPNDPHPGVPNNVFQAAELNSQLPEAQRAYARRVLDARQKYSDENAPEKREQTRLATEKARLEIEQLRANANTPEGVREFVFARREGMTKARTPAEYAAEKAAALRGPVALGEGQRLIGQNGEIIVGPGAPKAEREIAERTAIADRQGLQGDTREAYILNGRVPVGAEKTTEGQANAALYADRMKEAEAVFAKPGITEASMSRVQQGLAKVPSFGNSLVSNEFQQVEQAQRNFINAVLRRESGAVISEAEFDNARKQYFPQPGDKPDNLAQKARNRQTAIQGIANAAGPAYAKRQPAPAAAPPTSAAPSRADLEAEARRRGLIQ